MRASTRTVQSNSQSVSTAWNIKPEDISGPSNSRTYGIDNISSLINQMNRKTASAAEVESILAFRTRIMKAWRDKA